MSEILALAIRNRLMDFLPVENSEEEVIPYEFEPLSEEDLHNTY